MDFRFGPDIKAMLESKGHMGDVDIVSVAGAVKPLVHPTHPAEAEFMMRQLEISRLLHHTSHVILLAHEDCGAYGGRQAFADEKAERNTHETDLRAARDMIMAKLPEMRVQLMIAKLSADGEVSFEEITG
jgi:carbonic anhydrase